MGKRIFIKNYLAAASLLQHSSMRSYTSLGHPLGLGSLRKEDEEDEEAALSSPPPLLLYMAERLAITASSDRAPWG